MSFYSDLRGTAKSLLDQFGQTVKLVTAAGTVTTKGVRIDVKRKGQTIAESAAYLLNGNLTKVPSIGDYIQVGLLEYRISQVEVTNPGGTTLLFKCHVE